MLPSINEQVSGTGTPTSSSGNRVPYVPSPLVGKPLVTTGSGRGLSRYGPSPQQLKRRLTLFNASFGTTPQPNFGNNMPSSNSKSFGEALASIRFGSPSLHGSTADQGNNAALAGSFNTPFETPQSGFGNNMPSSHPHIFGEAPTVTGFGSGASLYGSTADPDQGNIDFFPSSFNTPFGTSQLDFGFGATSTANQTPFGQSQLFGKTPSTTGFGTSAPLFGSTAQQAGGALFSSSSVPSFGTTPQSGFGTGLFGQQQNAPGGNGLFTSASATTFGQQNKTAGFGFGASTTTPLFGQQQPQNFQPSTSSGVFGNTAGFGASTQMGTVIKFNPVTGTDTMQKSGITHTISTKHHCITCMKEYEAKSLEELRWEDYQCNRRGPQQQNSFGAPPFGAPASTAPSLFGQTENKPAFGQTTTFGASNGFGLTNQPNQQTLFGKPANTFGTIPTTNAFGSFNTTTPAFGTSAGVKPFGTQPTQNVFGTATTQPSAFVGNTFFGQTNAQNTSSFFNKPAQTAFNTQQPVFTFGQQTTSQSSLFPQAKPATGFSSFGQTNLTSNSGFGQQSNLFTQTPQNPFNAFQKPAQPTFGQSLQSGFGTAAQPGTNTFFGANKPLFGGTTQSNFFTPPSGGYMMPQQQQIAPNQSTGVIELQPQQDFHTIVDQLYELFPHRQLFDGIEVKNYAGNEATNPTVLKKIIEDAPLPITPPDNIGKLRLMPKPRSNSSSSSNNSKFSLLENTVNPSTPQNNFVLKNSTGKRLVLRKGVPKSEKDLLEEYKNMSSSSDIKNHSLFKNSVLEELNRNETSDGFGNTVDNRDIKQTSPRSLISPTPSKENINYNERNSLDSLQFEKLTGHNAKSQSTQTPPKTLSISKTKLHRIPLFNSEESDSDTQEETLKAGGLPSTDSLDIIESTQLTEKSDRNVQSPKGKEKTGKTVRFVDEDAELNTRTDLIMGSLLHHSKILENIDENLKDPNEEDNGNRSLGLQKISNPCGIKLTRPEYYTIPPLDEIHKYKNENGACIVKGFTVGRYGYGNVYFPDQMDVSNLDLDEIVHFGFRNVTIYPDDDKKPPVGQDLNRPAQVTLDHVWPRHRQTHEILKDPKDIAGEYFIDRLEALSKQQNAELVDYRPDTGSWVFTVPHFSKFRFTDADDEAVARQLEKTKQEQELKRKEMEKKQLEEKALETKDSESDRVKRGLGGIRSYEMGSATTTRQPSIHQTLSQARMVSTFRDDTKSALVMKSSFFDEESISDDVSSSDIGIVHHYSIPSTSVIGLASEVAPGFRKKVKVQAPKYYALLNHRHVPPMQNSLLNSRNYMDMGLFKGRSFRAGWGPGFTLLAVAVRVSSIDPRNRRHKEFLPNVVLRLEVGNLSIRPQVMHLEKHLQVVFEESSVTVDTTLVPLFTVKKDCNSLIRHREIAENVDMECNFEVSYYSKVWQLCLALWGPNANTPTDKCDLFSIWLEGVADPYVRTDLDLYTNKRSVAIKNIFIYLTGHDIENAAELAMEEDFPKLSMLISQASAHEGAKELVRDQLEQWEHSGIIKNIDQDILKIYMLLGGVPCIGGINVCENLDWKRALAIHLWYICSHGTSLIHAFQAYERAFLLLGYANPPSPDHYEFNNSMVYDVLYHIIQLYATATTPLEKIVDPTAYTEDPLDYRLSWLLLQVFNALKVGTISEEVSNTVQVSFASQLEQLGLWKWSIFVLLFMKDKSAKTNAIMAILDRNLDVNRTSKDNLKVEDSLVNDFKIPSDWIHTVLANKTNLLGRHIETYKHFILKSDWCKAHEVAITHLIPEFVSTGQCEKLSNLLNALIPGKRSILYWHTQAGLVIDFLRLHERIITNREQITEYDIRQLKGDLSGLCCRFKDFPTKSLKQILAVAELSRFIAILLKIIYCELQPFTKKSVKGATDLIKVLVMPPDYKQDELTKYVYQFLRIEEN